MCTLTIRYIYLVNVQQEALHNLNITYSGERCALWTREKKRFTDVKHLTVIISVRPSVSVSQHYKSAQRLVSILVVRILIKYILWIMIEIRRLS